MSEEPINVRAVPDPDTTLKNKLCEWQDWDIAAYSLGIGLGLMPNLSTWGRAKHVFWSNHSTGNLLNSILEQMVTHGILEKRTEPDLRYRWNTSFKGSSD